MSVFRDTGNNNTSMQRCGKTGMNVIQRGVAMTMRDPFSKYLAEQYEKDGIPSKSRNLDKINLHMYLLNKIAHEKETMERKVKSGRQDTDIPNPFSDTYDRFDQNVTDLIHEIYATYPDFKNQIPNIDTMMRNLELAPNMDALEAPVIYSEGNDMADRTRNLQYIRQMFQGKHQPLGGVRSEGPRSFQAESPYLSSVLPAMMFASPIGHGGGMLPSQSPQSQPLQLFTRRNRQSADSSLSEVTQSLPAGFVGVGGFKSKASKLKEAEVSASGVSPPFAETGAGGVSNDSHSEPLFLSSKLRRMAQDHSRQAPLSFRPGSTDGFYVAAPEARASSSYPNGSATASLPSRSGLGSKRPYNSFTLYSDDGPPLDNAASADEQSLREVLERRKKGGSFFLSPSLL